MESDTTVEKEVKSEVILFGEPQLMFAMIYSDRTLKDINKLCDSHEKGCLKYYKIDYAKKFRDDKFIFNETNRTVAIITKTAYDILSNEKINDFKIVPYDIRQRNRPIDGNAYAIYVSIPKEFNYELILKTIDDEMKQLVDLNFIEKKDYNIYYKKLSRKDEEVKITHCIITFPRTLSDDKKCLIKVYLDTSEKWQNDKDIHRFITWCRVNKLKQMFSTYSHKIYISN
jgi:hypothetical protein